MVTLKKYEAYLKVKRFIDDRDQAEIISRLVNETNYVSLIIESDGTDPIKYYSTSAAAKDSGVTKQTLDYAYRNRCTRIGGKEELKNLELSGWINFIWGEINLNVLGFEICRHFEIRWIPRYPREIVKCRFWSKTTSFIALL